MARIVFEVTVNADTDALRRALTTNDGITGWWTEEANGPEGEGTTMHLGFPVAPLPFELVVEEANDQRVRWSSVGRFPPHWVGTTVTWTFSRSEDDQTVVHFNHDGWASDEGPFPMSAYTWGLLLPRLAGYVESETNDPLFRRAT